MSNQSVIPINRIVEISCGMTLWSAKQCHVSFFFKWIVQIEHVILCVCGLVWKKLILVYFNDVSFHHITSPCLKWLKYLFILISVIFFAILSNMLVIFPFTLECMPSFLYLNRKLWSAKKCHTASHVLCT